MNESDLFVNYEELIDLIYGMPLSKERDEFRNGVELLNKLVAEEPHKQTSRLCALYD